MISSVLVGQYSQSRIPFAMSRDRLLPGIFCRVSPEVRDPRYEYLDRRHCGRDSRGVWTLALSPTSPNIGTLFAFVVVSVGVILLRRAQPDHKRAFRVPWVPFLPLLSIVCCLLLMLSLPLETWIRFFRLASVGLSGLLRV